MVIIFSLSTLRVIAAPLTRIAVATSLITALLIGFSATPASAEPVLEVDVGVDGYYSPGRSVPVRITVSADRLIEGHLDVVYPNNRGQTSTARIEVSMTGGSVKGFVTTVPTTPWNRARFTVNLVEGDTILAQAEPRLTAANNDDLVAVLPALAARSNVPNTARIIGDLGTARLGEFDLDDLSLGPAALESLDIMVGLPTEFGDLTENELDTVLGWVDNGGLLVIDGNVDGQLGDMSWLPDEWRPDERGKARAGAGEIQLIAGQAIGGNWDDLFPATRTRGQDEEQMLSEFGGGVWFGSISESIARDVNIRSIGLGLAVALLVGYALLAGPILFFILRRTRRHTLAWALIPALAFLGTGGAVASRSSFRPDNASGHATILATSPAGVRSTSYVLVGSSNGGNETVDLPDRWQTTSLGNEGDGGSIAQIARNDRIDLDLPPGGYGLVAATGPRSDQNNPNGLTIESISTGPETVEATVTNGSDATLEQVAVVVASSGELIGTMAPGETKTVTVERVTRMNPGEPRDMNWWPGLRNGWFGPRDFGPNGINNEGDDESTVSGGLWTEVNQSGGANFRPLGTALAIGWRSDVPSPLDDGRFDVGTTMVLTRGPIEPGGDHLFGLEVSRTLVRGPFGVDLDIERGNGRGEFFGEDAFGAYRYELPMTVDGRPVDESRLVAQLPDAAVAEVWVDDEWVTLRDDIEQPTVIALPTGALAGGTVLVKFGLSLERMFNGGVQTEMMIRESTADEEVAPAAGLLSADAEDEEGEPADG